MTAGRPPHEPDQPLNAPITMASTYVAGGELEYGRYGNPTWAAFEEALGALEGGRCLAFASGLAAVSTVLDLVALGEKVVVPRHAYQGSLGQLADLEMRGRVTPVRVDIEDTDGGGRGLRGRLAGVGGVADQPGARGRRPARDRRGRPRRGRVRRRSTTRSRPRCCSDRSSSAPTWSCTRPPSSSPGTPTWCWVRCVTRRRRAARRAQGPARPARRDPRHLRDLAGAARPSHAAAAGRARPGQRRGAGAPAAASGPRSPRCATPASARSSRSSWRGARWPPTCSRTRPGCGCTRPASAGSSRPSSDAAAGAPRRRPSTSRWCGCPSGSSTSRTSGTTWCRRWSSCRWVVGWRHHGYHGPVVSTDFPMAATLGKRQDTTGPWYPARPLSPARTSSPG